MIFLHRGATGTTGAADEATDREAALGDRVHAAIGAHQRSLEEHAALEALRVTHGCHGHIDAGAGFKKRRDVRGDHDRGGIFGFDLRGVDGETVALKNVGD